MKKLICLIAFMAMFTVPLSTMASDFSPDQEYSIIADDPCLVQAEVVVSDAYCYTLENSTSTLVSFDNDAPISYTYKPAAKDIGKAERCYQVYSNAFNASYAQPPILTTAIGSLDCPHLIRKFTGVSQRE